MYTRVPIYYPSFHCIASACRHTCCAGWEIGVDSAAAARYLACRGPLGEELRERMAEDGEGGWVFRLREDGRCPFLDDRGLCRVILEMGEEALCEICADHPRWRTFFSSFEEMGLGMACEEAARIILSEERRAVMVPLGEEEEETVLTEDEQVVLAFRARVLETLWRREMPLADRLRMLEKEGLAPETGDPFLWRDRLLSLERMDEKWTRALQALSPFSPFPPGADLPLEQAAVYFVMRHLSRAPEDGLMRERCALAVLLTRLLAVLSREGDRTETARLLSSEIEYSDENVPRLLEWIWADEQTGAQ